MLRGESAVRRVAAIRVRQAAPLLPQRGDVVAEAPLGPAAHDLRGVQSVERHALRGQAIHVVGGGDRRVRRPQVQPPGDGDDLRARLGLDLRPAVVRSPGEPDVVGSVVGEADDPAVVSRGAVGVPEFELLQAQDARAGTPCRPIGGRAAERAQPDHDDVPVAAVGGHGRDGNGAPGVRTSVCYRVRMNVRTNLLLPAELVTAVDELAGPRGRSRYVAEALEARVRRDRLRAAIEETAGAWKDHPLFPTSEAVVEWVREGRRRSSRPVGGAGAMTRYVLDSSFLIDHLRGESSATARFVEMNETGDELRS